MRTRSEGDMPAEGDAIPRRLYLKEPGWRVAQKTDSEKSYCYMMAPGQDYYHRLLDGEIYFYHGPERLCPRVPVAADSSRTRPSPCANRSRPSTSTRWESPRSST